MIKFLYSKIAGSLSVMFLCLILFSQATISAHAEAPRPPVPPQAAEVQAPTANQFPFSLVRYESNKSVFTQKSCKFDILSNSHSLWRTNHLFCADKVGQMIQALGEREQLDGEAKRRAKEQAKSLKGAIMTQLCEDGNPNVAPTIGYLLACLD